MVSLLAFFLLICVLVFVHEYGHFWAARRCGVKVLRFSIGFGKVLFRQKDKQGTEFAFSLIPLGGYVQMYNGEEDIARERGEKISENESLASKTIAQRAFIMFAGPLANFIFAILAYWLVFANGIPSVKPVVGEVIPDSIAQKANLPSGLIFTRIAGQQVQDWEEATFALVGSVGEKAVEIEGVFAENAATQFFTLDLSHWEIDGTKESPLTSLGIRPKSGEVKPTIHQVMENSVAENAGLQQGDRIIRVNNMDFDWSSLIEQVKTGNEIKLQVERAGQFLSFSLQPEKKDNRYVIGIMPTYEPLAEQYRTTLKYDMLAAFAKGVEKVFSLIKTILQFIGNLLSGELSVKNMGGPISMAKGAGATAEIGWIYYLSFMALISVNLGVMNLFPILPLDGGQLLLLSAEAIKGKPISMRFQLAFQRVGIFFVLGLTLFALINDVIHF